MAITLANVPIHYNSMTSPAHITTTTTGDQSHFDIDLKVVITNKDNNPLTMKDGDYEATISLYDADYDLTQLPARAVAIPVILGYVNKSDFTTFNFTTAVPNYDQQDFRRPFITRLRLNATDQLLSDLSASQNVMVMLSTYLLVIDLTDVQ